MAGELEGKVAIVTGSGSGIGRATAIRMAQAGAKVVLADRNKGREEKEILKIIADGGGEAIALEVDVSLPDEVCAMVDSAVKRFGRVDIAFNNAGIGGADLPTADYTFEEWNRVLAVNLTGVFLCMKYQLEQMLKQGSGSIINCSSILGTVGYANSSAYVAAKHGVIGLTRTSALEYARQGIRVNAICPGFIDTSILGDKTTAEGAAFRAALAASAPVGRMGQPEEVAEAVLWLASDAASFVTGTALMADGGYVAQ